MNIFHLFFSFINKFSKGSQRSKNIGKNIFWSFILKGANIAIQLALIPLTINYLDKNQYGIWLTLSSIIGWFTFFDIGLGNGLRNKLAECIAKGDISLAKTYVSTTYALLLIIFLPLILIFWIINPYIEWYKILNTGMALEPDLQILAPLVFSLFCFRFIFGLLGNVCFAKQMPSINNLITTIISIVSLVTIVFIKAFVNKSLFWVSLSYSAIPFLIFLIFSIYFYYGKFSDIRPGIRSIDFKIKSQLLGLGYKFFIIQVAGIVIFSSANIIITHISGPEEVTNFNIAYRYFTTLTMIYGIILTPYWSAFTDAYFKNDNLWIKNNMKILRKVSLIFVIVCLIMLALSDKVYLLWIGKDIDISFRLSLVMCLFTIFSLIASPFNSFINGTGKITLQYYISIVSILITIPIALLLGNLFKSGSIGVVCAMLVTTIPSTILYILQTRRILLSRTKNIWNK